MYRIQVQTDVVIASCYSAIVHMKLVHEETMKLAYRFYNFDSIREFYFANECSELAAAASAVLAEVVLVKRYH